jgi:hypothetical protein
VLPVTLAAKEVFEISRGNDQGEQVYTVVFALAEEKDVCEVLSFTDAKAPQCQHC